MEEVKAPVPQSAFVIEDDEEATPGGGAETTAQPMTKKGQILIQAVKREPVYVHEKNKRLIDSFTASGDVYQAFEAAIPL